MKILLLAFTHVCLTSAAFVSDEQVLFHLYTRESPTERIPLNRNDLERLRQASRIVFLIHGWFEDSTNPWYYNVKNGYVSRTDQNYYVIVVDWRIEARLDYVTASLLIPAVGNIVARFILAMRREAKIPLSIIEIVGFSLGAHIGGIAGGYLRQKESSQLRKIVGMDPAGPLFQSLHPDLRLSPDDAEMVLVIHSDRGVFGYKYSLGTIDFYPNSGGPLQPGCLPMLGCSHMRSSTYFAEAVNTGVFYARQCGSYLEYGAGLCNNNLRINIGQDISPNITGNFYARTNFRPPYNIPTI